MRKRNSVIITIILTLSLIITMMPSVAFAEETSDNTYPELTLDSATVVSRTSNTFMFKVPADGTYYVKGKSGYEISFIEECNWEAYNNDGEIDKQVDHGEVVNLDANKVYYVVASAASKSYNLTINRLNDWNDVVDVDFYALRDVYGGIETAFAGLGATFTFKDGSTFEYDGCYGWSYSKSRKLYHTEEVLNFGGFSYAGDDGEMYIYGFMNGNLDIEISGAVDTALKATTVGEKVTFIIKSTEESPVSVNDTVTLNVIESNVEKIEVFTPEKVVDAERFNKYYDVREESILVTYKDGSKAILRGNTGSATDEVSGITDDITNDPAGKECRSERNKIETITNQKANPWVRGEWYDATVKYMGVETTIRYMLGDPYEYTYDKKNIYKDYCYIEPTLVEIQDGKMKIDGLVEGKDYEVITWLEMINGSRTNCKKVEGTVDHCGDYLLYIHGIGEYYGIREIDVTCEKEGCRHESFIYSGEGIEPTCTTEGKTPKKVCSNCGKKLVGDVLEPLGHSYTVTVEALIPETCTEDGRTAVMKCERCDETIGGDLIPAKGHTEKILPPKGETCTESGLTEGIVCEDCGIILVAQNEIQALGHSGGQATCASKAICSKCGEEYGSLKAHKLKTTLTKATATKDGSKVAKCTECDEVTEKIKYYAAKTIKLSTTEYVYSEKAKSPSVIIKDSQGNTIASSNYTITKPTGRTNVGKYTYKVTFKNNYSGSKSLTMTINPVKTSITSLTKGTKSFTVKWAKKTTQVTGYQIQYSTSSSFKTGTATKTVTVTSNKTVSKTVKNLQAKKKYYVRVRTYKTVNGVKYYSAWTASKYVTTK